MERVDADVNFDFGTVGPDEKFDDFQFCIRWEGSVLAPDTGEYQFVVRTEHATRLWVNDLERPLIDAWVKSGNDTEYRGSLFLAGGRAYPLRLEFSKAKQGVDDSKKAKTPPPTPASIALLWKAPQRTVEVVPSRSLSPVSFAEAFVLATPFPPDDRSFGWERGTTVSKAWDQAATDAAIETAGYVATHADELAGLRTGAPRRRGPGSGNPSEINLDANKGEKPAADRPEKLREFARRFVERAFRSALTDEQKKLYVDRQFEGAKDLETAIKRVVLLTLKSPRFLYREVGGATESLDVASRLAFTLWDSVPDAELLNEAAAGRLATKEQITRQADHMLSDPRARSKVREFFLTWLRIDQPPDLGKDAERYPGFDDVIASDLRTSLELFLEDVAWGDKPDFRE